MSLEVAYVHAKELTHEPIIQYLKNNYRVHLLDDPVACLELAEKHSCAAIVSHQDIEPINGLQMLQRLKSVAPKAAGLLLHQAPQKTNHGLTCLSISEVNRVPEKIRRAIDLEIMRLHATIVKPAQQQLLFSSRDLTELLNYADQIAFLSDPLLITGETGTGKNALARYVHQQSGRKISGYRLVNCAAIPDQLFESEFFGHEKGAFTGAASKREGHFMAADEGTLVLDEIGELPLIAQAKLLQAIDTKEFYPIGSKNSKNSSARIVALTNRNLRKEVKEGRFREDLYHRLNCYAMHISPLRERSDDICTLAEHFLESTWVGWLCNWRTLIEPSFFEALKSLRLSGNVRDLQNLIRKIISRKTPTTFTLSAKDLPVKKVQNKDVALLDGTESLPQFILRMEQAKVSAAIHAAEGNVSHAARKLGVSRQNLQHRLKRLQEAGYSI